MGYIILGIIAVIELILIICGIVGYSRIIKKQKALVDVAEQLIKG